MAPEIITIPEGKICDYIDGKFRKDTPEEYVRQTIEKRLVNEHNYSPSRIKVEYRLKVGSKKPRADLVVFPEDSSDYEQEEISIIIECKKEKILPSNKKDGVGQLQSYMASCPNCEWGMWTNGKHKDVYRKVVNSKGKIEFHEYNDIPSADGNLEDINRPKRNTLKRAYEDNLLFVFKTCHNHIYVTDGLQKQPAFFELLKVIFCKIEDEKNVPNPLEFYATSSERSNPDGQLTVKKRISKIFEKVKKKFNKIFDSNDEIKLQPRSLSYIVSELQKYSLLDTDIDIKGKAYEELVGANLRGDRGEFFTPRNIMEMAVEMISPKEGEKICDTSCGTGGFLVTAMNYVTNKLKEKAEIDFGRPENEWTDHEKQVLRDRISEIASSNYFGFDINPDLVKATKMNMVMNNDGSGNILRNDSLLPPHEWSSDVKNKLAKALNIDQEIIRNSSDIQFFDVIVTNPPFGSKIPIRDEHILSQYDIAYIWQNENDSVKAPNSWEQTDRLQSSVPPEQLFIERCLQFLKPGGRIAIVLPDSILGSPGLGYIRQWLIKQTKIIASIDLHEDTFQPRNGTQTSILLLQKKTKEEKNKEVQEGQIADYDIFMAQVKRIGHDKRGNPLFKRDKHGDEILVPVKENVYKMGKTSGGKATAKKIQKRKIKDDQTNDVAQAFCEWKSREGISW